MDGADGGDRHAQLIEATIVPTLAYAARRVPEISDDIVAIDDAMRWGFAQERGIFETWDLLGVAQTVARMEKSGIVVAPWVKEMLAAGHTTFYRTDHGHTEAYSPITRQYEPVPRDPEQIDLAALKAAGKEVAASKGASLLTLATACSVSSSTAGQTRSARTRWNCLAAR